MWLSYELKQLE